MSKELDIGMRREFLNEDLIVSLSAMIGYSIQVSSWSEQLEKEGMYNHADIVFNMSNCTRKIDLDFDISTKELMRNSLYKLDTIISVCESMKADLKKARLLVNEGIKRKAVLDLIEKNEKSKKKY